MHYSNRYLLRALLLSICGLAYGAAAHAAQVSVVTSPRSPVVGQEFKVTVQLATGPDNPNVVEGNVTIPTDLAIEGVSTGGSGLSLWTVGPAYVPSDHAVEFAGGTPGGIPAGTSVPLFTITARADTPGTYMLSLASLQGYRNDGTGTSFPIASSSVVLTIVPGGAVPVAPPAPRDTTPPSFVSVALGSDPSLFDGRTFLTFFATDTGSGVSYYEVKEGWFGRYVRADRYYVLQDQSGHSPLFVRVVDAAGNRAMRIIPARGMDWTLLIIAGIILICMGATAWWYLRRRRAS